VDLSFTVIPQGFVAVDQDLTGFAVRRRNAIRRTKVSLALDIDANSGESAWKMITGSTQRQNMP
jgi:hypothetical protein